MYLLGLGLFVSLLNSLGVSGQLKQCTSQQVAAKGQFKCLDGCDENHKVGGTKKYCLSYFPDGGNCYLKPYTRNDVLTCNGKVSASTAPMWLVLVGGSNQFMMLKVLLDVLLNLPSTAGYNPTAYYGAHPYEKTGEELHSELAIMDFVWDANHNLLKKTAWWWDADCYFCLPSNTEEIFLDVPAPSKGSFRLSYISMHHATDFQERFELVVNPSSNWMNLNPTIHVYEEWTGLWDDYDTPQSVHQANVQYLKDRKANGVNIASLVFTDSAEDCKEGERSNIQQVRNAFAAVSTSFPKYIWSKRDMQYNELQVSGQCMVSSGHTVQPLNAVMGNRWYNAICNGNSAPSAPAAMPACLDLGSQDNTDNHCFHKVAGDWMGSIQEVCMVDYKSVPNGPNCNVRVSHEAHQQKRRACKLQHIYGVSADGELSEEHALPHGAEKVTYATDLRSLFALTQAAVVV